jgi:hypothetical protein
LGTELEAGAGELVQRALVLEEHDLAEGLPAQLETHRKLRHHRVPDVSAARIDLALAPGSTDHEPALAHGREHGIAVRLVEELAALAGRLEHADGLGVGIICPGES